MLDTRPLDGITLLCAHPDDEILFLWPFLQSARRIVCMVNDAQNPERQWCARRGEALEEVGRYLGVEVVNIGLNSEFYRMPTRNEELKRAMQRAMTYFDGPVATHNPWGEYGHIDHILCHHAAMTSGWPVFTTDICQEVNWLPLRGRAPGLPVSRHTMSHELFGEIKAIYDRFGCWTWSQPPVEECGVYSCS